MLITKRVTILTLFALSAPSLASIQDSLAVQDSTSYLLSWPNFTDTGRTKQEAPPTEVLLDNAVFTGMEEGATHQFLGIPFAYPP